MRAGRFCLVLLLALTIGIAHADIAVIVHPTNPIAQLQEKDVQKIFLGRLRMFPGTDLEVQALDLPEDHPVFIAFYARTAQMSPAKLRRYRAYYLFSGKGMLPETADSEEAMLKRVASLPTAIGYVDTRQLNSNVKILFTLPSP